MDLAVLTSVKSARMAEFAMFEGAASRKSFVSRAARLRTIVAEVSGRHAQKATNLHP
jgi:hypothetical protein